MSKLKIPKHVKTAWIATSAEKETPWGREVLWPAIHRVHGKILHIRAGNRTSLKYYSLKNEVLYVLKGTVKVAYGDELSLRDSVAHPFRESILEEGELLGVQAGSPYRIEAITDCQIIEIGESHTDRPIRIEDDYGRAEQDGGSAHDIEEV